ncbi:hypothetical protein G3I77_38060 [Streptomyces sp. D2-8]|uniref:hypothetical protein n=1 Tax=Streptomyces sp. D2-8 TaxID=2707767 RepID=UPI0020BDB54B|nr:hypothetical protein [Streptomyces sp. D2-8]MCK8438589.1 hypothetical protein [Streptomyces sp. D2-8]
MSTMSADSSDNPPTRENAVRPASADSPQPKVRYVPAPPWVAVKDGLVSLALLGWTSSLASGLTYRRWAKIGVWELTLTIGWASFLLLVAIALCLPLLLMSNFTYIRKGVSRDPSAASCLVLALTILMTLVCVIISFFDPELLPWIGEWGKTLSDTLLA